VLPRFITSGLAVTSEGCPGSHNCSRRSESEAPGRRSISCDNVAWLFGSDLPRQQRFLLSRCFCSQQPRSSLLAEMTEAIFDPSVSSDRQQISEAVVAQHKHTKPPARSIPMMARQAPLFTRL